MAVSLIVNAGGQSRRMGRNKALLQLPNHGPSLLAHIIDRLAPLAADVPTPAGEDRRAVILVANEPDLARRAGVTEPVRVVGDRWPKAGALGGIVTGLHYVSGWAMCVACDMPFVSPELMRLLLAHTLAPETSIDAVIPMTQGKLQPFHAVYHGRLAGHLAQAVAAGELGVAQALAGARIHLVDEPTVRGIDPALRALWNVNTPAEWAQAQAWLAESDSG